MADERYVITVLRGGQRLYYTGCRNADDKRILTRHPDDRRTLAYLSMACAQGDWERLRADVTGGRIFIVARSVARLTHQENAA